MKKLVVLVVLAAALLAPVAAQAHPLGNFTINRFARVEVSGHRLYVRYVLDLAEIPTFQARQQGVDARVYSARLARGLHVTLDGRRVALVPVGHALAFPIGVGGLHTMRLEVIMRGPRVDAAEKLGVHDTNYADRIGWKEIVVGAQAPSLSDELRAYPKSLLQSPLDITSATATVAPTSDPAPRAHAREGTRSPGPGRRLRLHAADHALAPERARHPRLARGGVLLGRRARLSPGHGKTIVTAYLIGKRGTAKDAALLGGIVTVTHTIGVFALGLVTLALSQWIVPDRLYPWIDLAAGLMVVSIGLTVLRSRARHAAAHRHGHEHHHHHDHEHDVSRRSLLAVGVSGGLLPCPSALVVLLAAISLHRLAFGLVLIVAFSLGLALSITGIGLGAVLAKKAFARRSFDGVLIRTLPAVSALVIVVAGVLMTAHALPKVH